jgi:hypothetical protein
MTLNTRDLYHGSVGVGTTTPYQTIPATAIVDANGNIVSSFGGGEGGSLSGIVTVSNDSNDPISIVSGLEIPFHNQASMTYDGSNNLIGIAYSVSGVGVATVTMTYDGSNNLTFVERTF